MASNPDPTKPVAEVQEKQPITLPAHLDPMQWGTVKRARLVASVCIPVLALTYCSSSYVSSLAYLMDKYDASREVAVLGVSLFVLGFGLGPLIFGPTSDLIGRRNVYLVTYGAFTAFSFGVVYANNITALLLLRFFAGMSGSSSLNNAPASIADCTNPVQRLKWTITYAICAFGGPSLGPLLGEFIQNRAEGNWNLLVNAIFVAVTWVWLVVDSPETHGPTLLARYEASVRPEEAQHIPRLGKAAIIQKYKVAMYKPFYLLFTEPALAAVCLYLSFLYALIYGLFGVFPIIYLQIRGFTREQFALTYFALGLGFIIGAAIVYWPVNWAYFKAVRACAPKRAPPDARFSGVYWTAWMVPLSFLLIATTTKPEISWAGNVIAEILFSCGTLIVFTSFIPFLVELYLKDAGSALAAATSTRAIFGCIFPLFTTQMYQKMGVTAASCVFMGISILLAPLPWVFSHYGYKLWPSYL